MPTEPATYVPELPKERPAVPRSMRETVRVEPPQLPPPAPRGRGWIGWLLVLALAGGAWYFRALWLPWLPLGGAETSASGKTGPRVIPVRTAAVVQRDMPLYLDGLGTVTALRTVTVKSRVDGELVRVEFEEGQVVKEGDLLAEIDPRLFEAQLQQAEGQVSRDAATLKLARLTLARFEDLLRAKSIAPQQLDEQLAQVQQLEATLQTDQAMVDNARLQLSYCRIVAPISGRIGLRLVDQGNIVHAGDLSGIAVITQMEPIAVVFTIPQDAIPRVLKQTGTAESLPVDAYNRDFRLKLASGKLAALDNQVDATTGTLKLKATFDNQNGMLFPNQFVNARLLVDTRKDALVVPSSAVQQGPNGSFVYVVQADETVKIRPVTAGPVEGTETMIESGLAADETVVTDGIDKLQDGAKVALREKGEKGDAAGDKAGRDRGTAPPAEEAPQRKGST